MGEIEPQQLQGVHRNQVSSIATGSGGEESGTSHRQRHLHEQNAGFSRIGRRFRGMGGRMTGRVSLEIVGGMRTRLRSKRFSVHH